MNYALLAAGAAPGAYYAFQQSDAMGKGIVILLIVGSVFTWTIMIDKFLALYRALQFARNFSAKFHDSKETIVALSMAAASDPGPVAQLYRAGVEKLQQFTRRPQGTAEEPQPLSDARLSAIEAVLEREESSQILELESRLGFLATIVSVSPFFGLFGTVWGVMLAFCSAAVVGRADIAALAPGVSGALLTTVVGLLVAIPSLIGYNLLTNTVRRITVLMDSFVESFLVRVRLEQLELSSRER